MERVLRRKRSPVRGTKPGPGEKAGPRSVDQAAIDGSRASVPAQMRVELCEWNAAPE
jgi:hypothetical protein